MKKILAAILCGAMLLSMTACGQKDTEETKETMAGTESAETAGETGAAGDSELKEVNIVLDWYPNAVHAFIYDAIERAIMQKRGLKSMFSFLQIPMMPCR